MCLCIHDHEIKPVSTTKVLGVILDAKLQWSDHINYIKIQSQKPWALYTRLKNISGLNR